MCALKRDRPARLSRDEAEIIALKALAFLAGDGRRLTRFLSLTGLDAETLSAGADSAAVQLAAVDHLMSDESLLLMFAGNDGVAPETIVAARALLDGPPGHGDRE